MAGGRVVTGDFVSPEGGPDDSTSMGLLKGLRSNDRGGGEGPRPADVPRARGFRGGAVYPTRPGLPPGLPRKFRGLPGSWGRAPRFFVFPPSPPLRGRGPGGGGVALAIRKTPSPPTPL